MPAPVVELCEAVTQHIKDSTYSKTFTVQRVNYYKKELADERTTRILVYPGQPLGSSTSVYTRDRFTRAYTVAVHIINFIDNPDVTTEIDATLLLAHEIEMSLENQHFGNFKMMAFESGTGGRPFFEGDDIQQKNLFHTLINIEFEGVV